MNKQINQVNDKISQYGLAAMTDTELLTATKFKGSTEEYYNSFEYKAASELNRRRERPEAVRIKSSRDCYELFSHLKDEKVEMFFCAYLNSRNDVIKTVFISKGTSTATVVNVPLILKEALNCGAKSIILCHNHPSGSNRPSEADRTITNKVKNAAMLLDMVLLDHIIVAHENFFSFADEGIL